MTNSGKVHREGAPLKYWCGLHKNSEEVKPVSAYLPNSGRMPFTAGKRHLWVVPNTRKDTCILVITEVLIQVKEAFPMEHIPNLHRGTSTDNRKYCSKSDDLENFRRLSTRGNRTDQRKTMHCLLRTWRMNSSRHGWTLKWLNFNQAFMSTISTDFTSPATFPFQLKIGALARMSTHLSDTHGLANQKLQKRTIGWIYNKNRSKRWNLYKQQNVASSTISTDGSLGRSYSGCATDIPTNAKQKDSLMLIFIISNNNPETCYGFPGYVPSLLLSIRINCITDALRVSDFYSKQLGDYVASICYKNRSNWCHLYKFHIDLLQAMQSFGSKK